MRRIKQFILLNKSDGIFYYEWHYSKASFVMNDIRIGYDILIYVHPLGYFKTIYINIYGKRLEINIEYKYSINSTVYLTYKKVCYKLGMDSTEYINFLRTLTPHTLLVNQYHA